MNSATNVASIEVLPAKRQPRSRKASKPRKTVKERIEAILAKDEHHARKSGEAIINSTGQLCYDLPWTSAADRPWKDGYTRVLIPLKEPTRKGKRCIIQIVRNSKLSHGRRNHS